MLVFIALNLVNIYM